MGTEGERLIDDYLSQVGDLARRALPPDERTRLVGRLREDIDRERRTAGRNPAAVRQILGRLGTPDEVVEEAASAGLPVGPDGEIAPPPFPGLAGPSAPGPEALGPDGWSTSLSFPGAGLPGAGLPGGGPAGPGAEVEAGGFDFRPEFQPEWWRVPGPRGVEADGRPDGPLAEAGAVPVADEPAPPRRRRFLDPRQFLDPRRILGRRPAEPVVAEEPAGTAPFPARVLPYWSECVAALLLVVGTVTGQFIVVIAGWVLAFYSRRLTRTQARIAALGPPILTVVVTSVWLWGRTHGKWGPPLADPRITPALLHEAPIMFRVAALASAAYLLWQADRASRSG
jgi:hypothetical protein